jgi:hypothetical protein
MLIVVLDERTARASPLEHERLGVLHQRYGVLNR